MTKRQMKAAVLTKLGEPLVVVGDIGLPDLSRGQVLVKVAFSGVCHSQLMEARGRRGEDRFLPHLLGHEGSGVVVEVGEGVTKVRPGDRVVLGWIKGWGIDSGGCKYDWNGIVVNAGGVTTFNDHAVVSENRLIPLPEGLPMDIAVLFGCAIPTGAGIVTNEIKPRPGSTMAIFGLGGIGLSALMATMLFQCSKVIAVDISDEKLALAREFGASHTVNSSRQDAIEEIRVLTDNVGVDYAVESSGLCEVIETAFDSVRRGGGLCVFASHPESGRRIRLDPFELICGKQIRGSWGGGCNPDVDIPEFARLYREGKLPLERLITKRYTLDQINDALDDLEFKRVGRPLVEINPSLGAG
jgi:S-(hydroxymethyl)glutathione dehydrogenase/alcohol dehydrogenase